MRRIAETGWLSRAAGGLLLLACGAGCGGGRGHERFIPSEETARQALEAALTAWRQGQPPGRVEGASPAAPPGDSHRRTGQKLRRYQILGPVPGDGPRVFVVRLALENPAEEQKVRFVVLGLDPLWVFRQEDFDMLAHWEHAMPGGTGKDGK